MARRGWGDDAIYWVERRKRYVGAASLGYGPDGKRLRKVVSGKTKQEVKDKLKALHGDLASAVRSPRNYTVNQAVDDWRQIRRVAPEAVRTDPARPHGGLNRYGPAGPGGALLAEFGSRLVYHDDRRLGAQAEQALALSYLSLPQPYNLELAGVLDDAVSTSGSTTPVNGPHNARR